RRRRRGAVTRSYWLRAPRVVPGGAAIRTPRPVGGHDIRSAGGVFRLVAWSMPGANRRSAARSVVIGDSRCTAAWVMAADRQCTRPHARVVAGLRCRPADVAAPWRMLVVRRRLKLTVQRSNNIQRVASLDEF